MNGNRNSNGNDNAFQETSKDVMGTVTEANQRQ